MNLVLSFCPSLVAAALVLLQVFPIVRVKKGNLFKKQKLIQGNGSLATDPKWGDGLVGSCMCARVCAHSTLNFLLPVLTVTSAVQPQLASSALVLL